MIYKIIDKYLYPMQEENKQNNIKRNHLEFNVAVSTIELSEYNYY